MNMNKIFKIIVIAIIILVVLSLSLSPIFAQENLQAPNKDVADKVDELIRLKDNNTLSESEKEIKEIQIRKEALDEIANLSLLEIKNLEDKLNSLEFTSDIQNQIKDRFLEILGNNRKYSEDLKTKLSGENLTLTEVKNLAQEYKDWRDQNYNNYVKKLTVFILSFQEKNVLKTANTRLEKIITDIKKLETTKILKKEDTWNLIESAMKSLTNAQVLNTNAEKIIIEVIQKDILIIASSTASTTISLVESATTTPETSEIEINLASTSAKIASSTPKILPENNAQTMIEKSLQEIKNTYNIFISISNKVKLKLK